jgi:hypothetical protein
MLRPFSVLISEAGSKGQDTSLDRQTLIKNTMNRFYQELWRNYMWSEVTIIDKAVSVAAGVGQLILPKEVDIIYAITNLESDILLRANSSYVFQANYIANRLTAAEPINIVKAGYTPLLVQPTADSVLSFVSSSASDTSQTITIKGLNSDSIEVYETITLTGTSEVLTTNTWLLNGITEIVKSARTTGTITIKQGSGGTTLDNIAPSDYLNRYDIIRLDSLTDSIKTYYVSGMKRFKELIYDNDIPEFDCCDGLIHYAVAEIHESRGRYQQAAEEKKQAYSYISALVKQKMIFEETGRIDSLPEITVNEMDIPILSN